MAYFPVSPPLPQLILQSTISYKNYRKKELEGTLASPTLVQGRRILSVNAR